MPPIRMTRREFLKATAVTIGVAGLVCTGIAALGSQQNKPEFTNLSYGERTMGKKILVAYASRAGSTVGVANAVAKTLAENGASVDVRQVETISDLSMYDAVVVGSAIQGQKWLPEAMKFMHDHQSELSRKPFASFMVCITLSMAGAEQFREGLKDWMIPVRNLVRPVSEGYFAGALDFSKLPFSFNVLAMRFVVLIGVWKAGDHRDWNAIQTWAKNLYPLLSK
jgi:menaquinone-dependent protoporphyrinogen oxidase